MKKYALRATAVVLDNAKENLLMIRRLKDGQEYYVLPGGHVEEGESSEDAVLRELKEETSVSAELVKKIFEFSCEPSISSYNGEGRIHQFFVCKYLSGIPVLMPNSEEKARMTADNIYEPIWFPICKMPDVKIWPEEAKELLIKYIYSADF